MQKFPPKGMNTEHGRVPETGRIPIAVRGLAVIPRKQKIVPAVLPPIRKKPNVQYAEVNMENC